MASEGIVAHESTAIGIQTQFDLPTDHKMVVMDCAVNCARVAKTPIPIWDRTKEIQYKFKPSATKDERAAYNLSCTKHLNEALGHGDLETQAATVIVAFKSEIGMIAKEATVCFPSIPKKRRGITTPDCKVNLWRRRLRRAEVALKEHRCTKEHVDRVRWRYTHKPEEFDVAHIDGASSMLEAGSLDELGQRLRAGIVQCDKHLRTT